MNINKCKICNKKSIIRGFCKSHYNAFLINNINFEGAPKEGYYLNENFYLRKIKDSLRQTVIESPWYRQWRQSILKRDNKTCVDCGKSHVKVVIHHEKIRFADIINVAKSSYKEIIDQLTYCQNMHSLDIGVTLCLECHSLKHKGEKVYSSLSKFRQQENCLICGKESYCKNFCKFHYQRFRAGIYNEKGEQIRKMKCDIAKGKCCLCSDEAKGKEGPPKNFCRYHLSQFYKKLIDINGNKLKGFKTKRIKIYCKVCDGKHSGNGFCLTHNNRYKLGQLDIDGNELRKLDSSKIKGGKDPNRMTLEFKGQKKYFDEWAEILGISRNSLKKRIKKWGLERALFTPKIEQKKKCVDDKALLSKI